MDIPQELLYLTKVEDAEFVKQESETFCEFLDEDEQMAVSNEGNRKLMELLQEFNLEIAFDALDACGFTYDRLRYINKDDLNEVFPGTHNIGLKAELREKIAIWKSKNVSKKDVTTVNCHSKVLGWVQTQNFSSTSSSKTNVSGYTPLRDILQQTKGGQGIIKNYANEKKLSSDSRKRLLNCIVEFYYDARKKKYNIPRGSKIEKIAKEIVEIFPSETKDIYYVSRKEARKANPTGLLFNRFNNLNRKCSSEKEKTLEDTKRKRISATSPNPELLSIQNKMKTMQNDENNSMDLWQKTFSLRSTEIKAANNLNAILDGWPFFKQSGADKFIDYDFDMLLPGKRFHLINKWDELATNLSKFYKNNLKQNEYKILFDSLSNEAVDKNSRDCVLIMLLNAVLKPTSRIVVQLETGKTIQKTTIKDAINSCIVHITTVNDLQMTKELKIKCSIQRKNTIQPYIIVIGQHLTSLSEFYVSYGETLQKFTSFIAAMDICFKVYHVFDIEYSKESVLLWLFLQQYIYEISTIYDAKSSVLSEFIQNFKN